MPTPSVTIPDELPEIVVTSRFGVIRRISLPASQTVRGRGQGQGGTVDDCRHDRRAQGGVVAATAGLHRLGAYRLPGKQGLRLVLVLAALAGFRRGHIPESAPANLA